MPLCAAMKFYAVVLVAMLAMSALCVDAETIGGGACCKRYTRYYVVYSS